MSPRVDAPRVWLISAEFTSQLGGGFRQQRWCECFLRRGVPVRVYCIQGLHRVAEVDFYSVQEIREQRARWIAASPPQAGVRTTRFASIARWLKHTLLLDFFFPSVCALLFKLNRALSQQKEKVVILCSSPPFTSAFVSAAVKTRYGNAVYLALDMRDLWSLHAAIPGIKFHKRIIERFVMKHADVVTTVAIGLASRFESAFGRKTIVAYNVATHVISTKSSSNTGFEWSLLHSTIKPTTIKILYTGSLPEGYYDLGTFVAACQIYCATEYRSNLQFIFIGASASLQQAIRISKIPPDMVVFAGQHPHSIVHAAQAEADALLFFGFNSSDNQGQVSIKLFEYFRSGRPIMPLFIKENSDIDLLIHRYCGKTLRLENSREIADLFHKIGLEKTGWLPTACNMHVDEELLGTYEKVVDQILAGSI